MHDNKHIRKTSKFIEIAEYKAKHWPGVDTSGLFHSMHIKSLTSLKSYSDCIQSFASMQQAITSGLREPFSHQLTLSGWVYSVDSLM